MLTTIILAKLTISSSCDMMLFCDCCVQKYLIGLGLCCLLLFPVLNCLCYVLSFTKKRAAVLSIKNAGPKRIKQKGSLEELVFIFFASLSFCLFCLHQSSLHSAI